MNQLGLACLVDKCQTWHPSFNINIISVEPNERGLPPAQFPKQRKTYVESTGLDIWNT